MRRFYALVVGVVLLFATPGLAAADTYAGPAGRQQAINTVLARALSQRGVPYVWGGGNVAGPTAGTPPSVTAGTAARAANGIDPFAVNGTGLGALNGTGPGDSAATTPAAGTVGFDASGLIQFAFAGVGIKLPRSSGEQYKVGRKVLPAQALPGDLIFYGPEGTQSVALFVGNGQMLEATEPAVTVSPVRMAGMTPYLTRIIGS